MKKDSKAEIKKIVLDGSLTIQRAEEIKTLLWEIGEKKSGLELDVSNVEHFDLSFLQTLFLVSKKYKKEEKTFLVNTNGKTLLPDIIYKAGLENQLNSIFYSE